MAATDDPLIAAVDAELEQVRRRRIDTAFGRLGEQGALPITALRDLAERNFPDEWKSDPAEALTLLLKRAIDRLDGFFVKEKICAVTDQEAALGFFNLDGAPNFPNIKRQNLGHVTGHKHAYLGRQVYEKAQLKGQTDRTRKLEGLRRRLATVLVEEFYAVSKEVDLHSMSEISVVRSTLADEFIARPDYEQLIRQVRDSGETHLWLWGDAGTGKTRLARAANRDYVAERSVPVLVASNEQTLQNQMIELVVASGMDASIVNAANYRAIFRDRLSKGMLPKALVFDEMVADDLLGMLTATPGSFIVFTSIQNPPPAYLGTRIEVRDLTSDESEQMIRSRLPQIGNADLALLNSALAGRPLAIEHSCAFLRETGLPIGDYCIAVTNQPARTLDAAGAPRSRTLTRVYQLILQQFTDESLDASRLLDYVLFASRGAIDVNMLSYLWVDNFNFPSPEVGMAQLVSGRSMYFNSLVDAKRWPGVVHNGGAQVPYIDPVSMIELRAALRRLVDFGLIRSEGDRIVMHQLTRSILLELRHDRIPEVFERVKTTVHRLLVIDGWKPGEPVQVHTLSWAPHVAWALAHVDAQAPGMLDSVEHEEVKKLALLGAMVVRAHMQVGVRVVAAVKAVLNVYGLVRVRACWTGYDDDIRADLFPHFAEFDDEIARYKALSSGFSREYDAVLSLNEMKAAYVRQINGMRFHFDTEWELAHSFVRLNENESSLAKASSAFLKSGESALKRSAEHAMEFSRVYYDECRWTDAIGALEHAYSCYLKIGGDVGAIKGAIDAARRLARVYLRAGPPVAEMAVGSAGYLDEATWWLMRAQAVKRRRSDAILNGAASRYQLRDALLEAQLRQTLTQIELNRLVFEWENMDEDADFLLEKHVRFITEPYGRSNGSVSELSRLGEAHQDIGLLREIGGQRLLPEFWMHILKLYALANDAARIRQVLEMLGEWFKKDNLTYQSDLLALQSICTSVPAMAAIYLNDEVDLLAAIDEMTGEEKNTIRTSLMDGTLADGYRVAARTMLTHHNRYWYARGLAAALMIGTLVEREQSWINDVRAELHEAAVLAGRPDWVTMADEFCYTNAGLWLIAY